MDALSDILRAIRLRSAVYFRSDFSSPWGMQIDDGPFAQFHLIVRGNCWMRMRGFGKPRLLSGGDVVVFPHGDAHWLADDPAQKRAPGKAVVQAHLQNQPMFQQGEFSTTLVCGHFEFDRHFDHPFLQALPRFIHITDTERRERSWLETVTNVIIQEADSAQPGAEVVVERLAEVLFIQVLRAYMQQQKMTTGYLAALQDRQISQALKLVHARPETNWTLESISRTVGMSRSAFAARFKQLVGVTPMVYITDWRMQKARELLKNHAHPLVEVAEKVGYTSEAAFNRAFKRRFKQNPGAMRRALLAKPRAMSK